jgi:hypothetical protein
LFVPVLRSGTFNIALQLAGGIGGLYAGLLIAQRVRPTIQLEVNYATTAAAAATLVVFSPTGKELLRTSFALDYFAES